MLILSSSDVRSPARGWNLAAGICFYSVTGASLRASTDAA